MTDAADSAGRETQQSITDWSDTLFGVPSDMRLAARANEEMAELLTAIASGDQMKAGTEIADVVIVLSILATHMGFNLAAEIDRKMRVNREREWRVDASGCGYHVR